MFNPHLLIGAGALFVGYKAVKGITITVQEFRAKQAEERRREEAAKLEAERAEAQKKAYEKLQNVPEKLVEALSNIADRLGGKKTED